MSDPLFPWEEIRLRYAPSPLWVPRARTVSELDAKLATVARTSHGAHPQLGGGVPDPALPVRGGGLAKAPSETELGGGLGKGRIAQGVSTEEDEMRACAEFLASVLDTREVLADGVEADELTNPGMLVSSYHTPVLANEVMDALRGDDALLPDGIYIDATLGGGGHSALILEENANARVIGIDQDADAIAEATARLAPYGDRFSAVHANFDELMAILEREGVEEVQGILMDLGVSSHHFDTSTRGFSFQELGPLDMRMDTRLETTAADLVNTASQRELTLILRELGEERHAARIAAELARRRTTTPLRTTEDLVQAVRAGYGERNWAKTKKTGTHPATRTFQALRIAVNRELDALEAVLPQAFAALADGGRLVVISFHSLEDRIVKHFMRELAEPTQPPANVPLLPEELPQPVARLLNRKPVTASEDELKTNRRARSAKLRALVKLEVKED